MGAGVAAPVDAPAAKPKLLAAQDDNALDSGKSHSVAAAEAPTQAPAAAAPVDPVTALLMMPGALIQAAAGLLATVVTPLLAPFIPSTPTETPLMWTVLAWVRRQFDVMAGITPAAATQTPAGLVEPDATVADLAADPVVVDPADAPADVDAADAPVARLAATTASESLAAPAAAAPADPVTALLTTVGTLLNNTVSAVFNTLGAVLTPNVTLPGDQTAALQAQLDALRPGQTLTLQANTTYQHSGVLYIRVPGVTINGNGATLQATSAYTSALQITAANVTVNNLNLTAPAGYPRNDGTSQSSLVISANGATINDVNITNSASTGVIIGGVTGFTLNRVNISNTMADGVQMTGGASNGVLNNVTVTNSGDDSIAIVSYSYAGVPLTPNSTNIAINNAVINGSSQRGITIAGADGVTITNPTISNTSSSGIYIGSQLIYPYAIQSVSNVTVTGGSITNASNGPFPLGAITVASILAPVSNVTISGTTIRNTPPSAIANIGLGVIAGSITNLKFQNIAIIEQPELIVIFPLLFGPASYTATGFTMNGRPITVT